jgi:outer membrane protein insertion porin family
LEQDRNVRLSTLSATFIKDTRDKPLDAHRGVFSTLNLGITPTAFGSSANFGKFFGQYSYYRPMKGLVWANSVRLGLAKPFSGSFVPTSQLFFTGGGNTIRGFPLNGAGPQRLVPFCAPGTAPSACTSLITVPIGGRQLFILNSELRFPLHIPIDILKPLGAVAFYDGGNVYRRINFNDFVNSYTNTVGVGLRYATPIGPVRIDLGRNLNPVPGVGSTQYFITLGQSF